MVPRLKGMTGFRSPQSIAIMALAVALIAVGLVFLFRPVSALAGAAGTPWVSGLWHAGGFDKSAIPPELAGLADVPADQRFSHFRGVQVQLTDTDNRPVRVDVTPGTVTSVGGTSLTIVGNDGATHTYALDNKTMQRGAQVTHNARVVVASLNGSNTAMAVFAFDGNGFGPRGPWGH
jgi:hypothetical protein